MPPKNSASKGDFGVIRSILGEKFIRNHRITNPISSSISIRLLLFLAPEMFKFPIFKILLASITMIFLATLTFSVFWWSWSFKASKDNDPFSFLGIRRLSHIFKNNDDKSLKKCEIAVNFKYGPLKCENVVKLNRGYSKNISVP